MKHTLTFTALSLILAGLATPAAAQSPTLANYLELPGNATDLAPGQGANMNRLGMGSDLYYDRRSHALYSLADRGPGGGTISYETRVHKLKVNIDSKTGEISHFRLQETIKFKTADGLFRFNGLNPQLLNGDPAILGLSFDPEGFTIGADGHFFVSDEYGPSVYEFAPYELTDGTTEARFVRAFAPPANLLPHAGASLDFVNGRGILTTGRQDNRGYEGLTISPNGLRLYAILQDPLIDEGPSAGEGRRSRNVRIVEYDVVTGTSLRQFVYQLETLADINSRVPGTVNDFAATAQGRNIGCSGILAINATEFLVIERDNRGRGVDDPLSTVPIASKRIFRIDISGATDVSGVSLAGFTTALPAAVTPVTKSLFMDVQTRLAQAGIIIPEKFEGIAVGPELRDGSYSILLANDNDFSVTQNASGTQLDVYTDGSQGPLDGEPAGRQLMPSLIFAFKGGVPGFGSTQQP